MPSAAVATMTRAFNFVRHMVFTNLSANIAMPATSEVQD
jgi:hypothetical protein